MTWMRGNHDQTWKYYGKPTRRKIRTWEVLRKNTRLRTILQNFWINGSCAQYCYHKKTLEDQGKTCMLLGYAQNHTGGTYHMLLLVQFSQKITHIQAYIRTQKRTRSYTEKYLHRTKWPIDRPTSTAADTATASADASADAPSNAPINAPA